LKRVFLDSDIILDFLLERSSFFAEAEALFALVDENRITGCTSPIVLSNLTYLLKRQGLPVKKVVQICRDLMNMLVLLPVNDKILEEALDTGFRDIEDSFQYITAVKGKCDAIITRNKSDYKNAKIPVYTPHQFLEFFH